MKLFYKIVNKVTNFGKAKEVFNKNRKFGSNESYIHIKLSDNGGTDILLTKNEYEDAVNRAKNNLEDYTC
jgi:hypothetical protein